jgi:2-dehydro-3-deoxyphosphogluconate aldolase/(4S)-4-hydroxy-2-oxoglutarate aldolase
VKHFEIMRRLRELAVIPIVRTSSEGAALSIVGSVILGGINCVEITLTVPNALRAIEKVANEYGDRVLIGAGTVLDPETARSCMLAGAQFFVTPSLNLKTIELARRYSRPIFPGALTPTEIVSAWEAGADAVKVFPCSALGGAKYIKAVKAPFPQIELIPTGGVNLETVADFITAGSMAVGVGSELVDSHSINSGNYEIVSKRARQFLEIVRQVRSAEGHAERSSVAVLSERASD